VSSYAFEYEVRFGGTIVIEADTLEDAEAALYDEEQYSIDNLITEELCGEPQFDIVGRQEVDGE
jgi:hypothetical protein